MFQFMNSCCLTLTAGFQPQNRATHLPAASLAKHTPTPKYQNELSIFHEHSTKSWDSFPMGALSGTELLEFLHWTLYVMNCLRVSGEKMDANCRLQIDSMTLAYATSRLNGISSPANAAYSASELEFQMRNAGAKALFTVCTIAWSSITVC